MTLSGTYRWTVTTTGPTTAVEFWATANGVNTKLATITGTGTFTYTFDTTKLANGDYLFGIVEVNAAGTRYPDSDRRTATIANTTPPTTTTTTTTATTTTPTPTTTTATPTAGPPATASNSLTNGITLSGTYHWTVTTTGPTTAVEFWATANGVNTKLATITSTGTFTYTFDTTKLANGSYLFGIVEVDASGNRYPDNNRRTATIANTAPATTTTTTPATTATTTTTTTTATPPGSVIWNGDYETGDWSQWNQGGDHLQCDVPGASASVQTAVTRQGKYAARFMTPPYDGSTRSRCQTYLRANASYGNSGQDEWYGFSFQIAPGSTLESGGWNNLVSWHQSLNSNTLPAPDHVTVTNSGGTWTLRIDSWGGNYNSSTGWNQYRQTWNLMQIQAGKWYDVVVHLKWSNDPNVGYVEAWINGQHVLAKASAATLYTGDSVYLKEGYDGGGATGSTTVYQDSMRIAHDYAGAISGFPAGSWPATAP